MLVIHHLAVDGVSWRILLPDLHAAYEGRASTPSPPRCGPGRTASPRPPPAPRYRPNSRTGSSS
ncbi:non-ribosomal peptide synthetase [Kitasatospora cheerisanensis KCTC 2395]|uniref:Non-ribosomal peptide synthetase n=1 Tax=Kitasatospora cheerisanensis KCTC 2395 TaxID=1348663 RepID=A0A066Z1H2_9ACTN|nr:non-ribosomal peptide synthetase [Kitasatospora cheerisanensis KCTC 2395]